MRRRLDGLLSSGAADALRNEVVANPALVGQTVRVPLLLSADVDLYFKGLGTTIEKRPGTGALSLSGASGEVSITASADNFPQRAVRPPDWQHLVALNGGVVKISELDATGAKGEVLITPTSSDAAAGNVAAS